MKGKLSTKIAATLLGVTLFGGVTLVTKSETVAHASTFVVPAATYNSDMSAMKTAMKMASPSARASWGPDALAKIAADPKLGYANVRYNFNELIQILSRDSESQSSYKGKLTKAYTQDSAAVRYLYHHFRSRLRQPGLDFLDALYTSWGKAKTTNDKVSGVYNVAEELGGQLGEWNYYSTLNDTKVEGVTPVPYKATPKSYISKLTVKKTASKKYVKVSGTAKLHVSANYAQIHTYKGYTYAKLSSKHNFSKTIHAPKAKTVKVNVGYYSYGNFVSITSTKTTHLK